MRHKNAGEVKVKVAVCISVYNDITLIKSLLETIRYFTDYPDDQYGIVILDDGSREEMKLGLRYIVEQNQAWKENIYLIEHSNNQGISATWNHLLNFYDSEYTIMLNNDILVNKFWMTSLIYFLENNKCGTASLSCWFCPPQFIDPIKKNLDSYEIQVIDPITKEEKRNQPINYIENDRNVPGMVMAPMGALFGFNTALGKSINGFDERFRSFYEEIDFGTHLSSMGYASYVLPFPYCYHVWGHTFAHNPELDAENTMNLSRIKYKNKWGGDILPSDPKNPHPVFMSKIKPQVLHYLVSDCLVQEVDGVIKKIPWYSMKTHEQTKEEVAGFAKVG